MNTVINISDKSWVKIYENFVSVSNEEFEEIWNLQPKESSYIKMFGKTIKIPRKQALFGETTYTFSGKTNEPRPLENKLMIDVLAKINEMEPDHQYNGVFVNWYKDGGEYISWHSDNEKDLNKDAPLYSLSLGATRKFKIKSNETKVVTDIELKNEMMVVMGGDMQNECKHSVPKTKRCNEGRINFTFRSFV
uniref:Alkylated DNA repair dioxygenase n=1 Tax=Marseillevirus LCMAC201 TaxID=2506605 RepID=A0A481YXT6_9VIRU|nr:MAG: alkylated DNA repair dioxygenase [Marseillevirus LCMAC201]